MFTSYKLTVTIAMSLASRLCINCLSAALNHSRDTACSYWRNINARLAIRDQFTWLAYWLINPSDWLLRFISILKSHYTVYHEYVYQFDICPFRFWRGPCSRPSPLYHSSNVGLKYMQYRSNKLPLFSSISLCLIKSLQRILRKYQELNIIPQLKINIT